MRKIGRSRLFATTVAAVLSFAVGMPTGASATVALQPDEQAAATESDWAVTGGNVIWGVKESLRRYVPGGGEARNGAQQDGEGGVFTLPIETGTYNSDSRELNLELGGDVIFDHEAHTFQFEFTDFIVDVGPNGGSLSAQVTTTITDPTTGEKTTTTGTETLVTLDTRRGERAVASGTYDWTGLPTRLTAEGAKLFEAEFDGSTTMFYSEGTPFDPLTINAVGEDWPEEGYTEPDWTAPGTESLVPTHGLSDLRMSAALTPALDEARGILWVARAQDNTTIVLGLDAATYEERARFEVPAGLASLTLDGDSGTLVAVSAGGPNSSRVTRIAPTESGGFGVTYGATPFMLDYIMNPFFASDGQLIVANKSDAGRLLSIDLAGVQSADIAAPDSIEPRVLLPFVDDWNDPNIGTYDPDSGLIYVARFEDVVAVDPSGEREPKSVPYAEADIAFNAGIAIADGTLFASAVNGVNVFNIAGGAFEHSEVIKLAGPGSLTIDPENDRLYVERTGGDADVVVYDTTSPFERLPLSIAGFGDVLESPTLSFVPRMSAPPMIAVAAQDAVVGSLVDVERMYSPAVTTQPSSTTARLTGAEFAQDGSLTGANPTDVTFSAAADGTPAPTVIWQMRSALGWEDLTNDDRFSGVDTPNLTVTATEALDETQYRAVFRNAAVNFAGAEQFIGHIASEPATLDVEVVKPDVDDPTDGGNIGVDGSVRGEPNRAGASTTVKPGVELKRTGSNALTVSGSGFTKNVNQSGIYALFGYVSAYPSAGGNVGEGYDYIRGGGSSGQEGQLYVAWPDNTSTGSAANAKFSSVRDGSFTASGLRAESSFTGQSGKKVNCLDGSVQCGVITFGAHGTRDANLETFTPVYFDGQKPGIGGTAPTITSQPGSTSVVEGSRASFAAAATGQEPPTVRWQVKKPGQGSWRDVRGATSTTYTTGALARSDSGTEYRAVFTNSEGQAITKAAAVTVRKKTQSGGGGTRPGAVNVQSDGSIIGEKNARGAYTQVRPGTELSRGGTTLRVDGKGFTRNTNASGVYVLFGYMVNGPSTGVNAGNGYDFNPGGGASGQEGQLFIAWPGNSATGSAANGRFSSAQNGEFSASGLYATPRFTGQSGARVDCLDGSVVCGVITIGAHGDRDAALETFTPVFFDGQRIPTGPVTFPDPPAAPRIASNQPAPPAIPLPSDGQEVEGSLVWGVKSSFRSYISGPIARGSVSVSDGASSQNGLYWFGQRSTDWTESSGTGTTGYGGSVRFTGHSGVLDLRFSNPSVRIDSPSSGTLSVTINGTPVAIGSMNLAAGGRTEADGSVSYSNVPVTLTAAGARVFSYGSSQFYTAGTPMDPASFVIGTASTSTPSGTNTQLATFTSDSWTAPAEPPSNEGIWIDPEQLANLRPGDEVTAIAEGFEPNESDARVVLYSDPVVLESSLESDAEGVATWTGIIPVDTEPGTHTLTFQGSVDRGIEIEVNEPEELEGCVVTSASMSWGFKESFRSYISGSIANGEWELSDGATYDTPEFAWSDGEGRFDAELFTGQVSMNGAIRFTGHGGLLDTTVANPTIVFTGPETAYVLLDVAGLTMEDALAGETENVLEFEQVSFVQLDLSAGDVTVTEDGNAIQAVGVPATITGSGYEAFPNYEAGTSFDPVSFSIATTDGCAPGTLAAAESITDDRAAAEPISAASSTWMWWTGGGLLVVAILGALWLWFVRSRRSDDGEVADDAITTGASS